MGPEPEHKLRSGHECSGKALQSRTTESLEGLVHHSDQGVQYESKDYVDYPGSIRNGGCVKYHGLTICPSSRGQSNSSLAFSSIKSNKTDIILIKIPILNGPLAHIKIINGYVSDPNL